MSEKHWKNKLLVLARKRLQAESFQQHTQNKPVGRDEIKKTVTYHVKYIRYQPFVAVSGSPGEKLPVVDDVLWSHEQKLCPTTSLEANCIDFEF